MRIIQKNITAISLITLLTGLTGCGSDSTTEDPAANATAERAVTIPFAAVSGTQEISCNTLLTGLGTNAAEANLVHFAFYVHDVVLKGDDNNDYPVTLTTTANNWQYQNIALLDFQDQDSCDGTTVKETNDEVTGTIDIADNVEITGIKFKVGVPFPVNHGEMAVQESPLNLPHLYWNWQGGYKYARLDVKPVDGITADGIFYDKSKVHNIHLGATSCTSGGRTESPTVECANPNIPEVDIDLALGTQAVKLDYKILVEDSTITEDSSNKDGCMSFPDDDECPAIFEKLGLDYADDTVSPAVQSVFSPVDL